MNQNVAQTELMIPQLDVDKLVTRLDKTDILLLRYFYVTGRPFPDDTDNVGYFSHIILGR